MRLRFPDPALVPVPTVRPRGRLSRMTTRSSNNSRYPVHDHEAVVDPRGDGVTDTTASHFHRVVGGRVEPGDDGHEHRLTIIPGGM